MKPHEKLPSIVRALSFVCDGWIVGSSAKTLALEQPITSDIDVVINHKHWDKATKLVSVCENVNINSFGGYKIQQDNMEIDVWMDDVASLFTHGNQFAYHLKSGVSLGIIIPPSEFRKGMTI